MEEGSTNTFIYIMHNNYANIEKKKIGETI